MKRTLLPLTLAALGLGAGTSSAQVRGDGGMIYGSNYSFLVDAPTGWIMDLEAGSANGLAAVFYRAGESWADGAAVMYVNTSAPDSGQDADPLRIIAEDSARFVSRAPEVHIVAAPSLQTHDHRVAYVRYFSGQPNGRYEAVAYIAEHAVTPMIVLSGKTESAFTAALPAFAQLVESYSFLSSDVRVKHRPARRAT